MEEVQRCRHRLLRLLGRREHTRSELRVKARRWSVAPDVLEAALDRLEEAGALDDRRAAQAYVAERLRSRPAGRALLRRDLGRRGVADAIIAEALAGVDAAAEEQAARRLLARRLRTLGGAAPEVRRRRLLGALQRGGFPGELAYRLLDEIEQGLAEEEEELEIR